MKTTLTSKRNVALAVMFIIGFNALPVEANIVFQADFNGDGGGTGGASDIVTVGGTGAEQDRLPEVDAEVITASPALSPYDNSGGYLLWSKAAATDGGGVAGVAYYPSSAANWVTSWYTDGGAGNDTLVGAVDYFYQQNSAYQSSGTADLTFLEPASGQGMRMSWSVDSDTQVRLFLKNQRSNQILVNTTVNFQFKADTLYHIAMTADGTAGNTSLKLFIKEGDVPINPSVDTPVVSATGINIDNDGNLASSFQTSGTAVRLGARGSNWDAYEGAVELRFDKFRVYDAVPDTFSTLGIPPKGSLITIQ